jgi:hypothetical protein
VNRRVVAGGLASLALALGACTSVKVGLGTRDSVCFSSLPEANRVVGVHAKFAGVRYLSSARLLSSMKHVREHHLVPPDSLIDMGRRGACVFGYRGDFRSDEFPHAWFPELGPYRFAVVVVRQDDQKVVGVVLLRRPPVQFFHLS